MRMIILRNWLLKTTVLAILSVLSAGPFYGQVKVGFVGDELIEDLWTGDHMNLTIGAPGPTNNSVYHWSLESVPDGGGADIANPSHPATQITCHGPGTYEFKLTRASKFGYQEEYVVVTLYEEIVLVRAVAKEPEKCYTVGQNVREDDFKLVTQPPGYDDRVRIIDEDRVISSCDKVPIAARPIHFMIQGQEGVEDVTAHIPVVNTEDSFPLESIDGYRNNVTPASITDAWDNFKTFAKVLKTVSTFGELNQLASDINDMAGWFGIDLELPTFPVSYKLNPKTHVKMGCCNDRASTSLNMEGTIELEVSIDKDEDIANVKFVGKVSVSGEITLGVEVDLGEEYPVLSTETWEDCYESFLMAYLQAGSTIKLSGTPDMYQYLHLDGGLEVKTNSGWKISTTEPHVQTAEYSEDKPFLTIYAFVTLTNDLDGELSKDIRRIMLYPKLGLAEDDN